VLLIFWNAEGLGKGLNEVYGFVVRGSGMVGWVRFPAVPINLMFCLSFLVLVVAIQAAPQQHPDAHVSVAGVHSVPLPPIDAGTAVPHSVHIQFCAS
jgi:hypothetical protein